VVEPILEYDSKVKYFVGGGNNCNLIKGIMKRRPWFQLTDKAQDAQFVWTQIKLPAVLQSQRKGDPCIFFEQADSKKKEIGKAQKGKHFNLFNAL
jgi:hypothetical protein